MRVLGAVLAVVGVLSLYGQPGRCAAYDRDRLGDLAVGAATGRAAAGAVTSVDAGRLTQQDRVVLAPATVLPGDLESLWVWASSNGSG
jgi:hypothetical protein